MPEAVIVKFYSPVSEASIGALMKVVDQKLAAGVTHFTVLISTSGGSVFHGLTAYNYLKGIPRRSRRTTSAAWTRSAWRCSVPAGCACRCRRRGS